MHIFIMYTYLYGTMLHFIVSDTLPHKRRFTAGRLSRRPGVDRPLQHQPKQ